jgi:hypothetical protein
MQAKTCPRCNKTSYSAEARPWICPYCGLDIAEVPINDPVLEGTLDEVAKNG